MNNAMRAMMVALAILIATPMLVLAHKQGASPEADIRNLGPIGGKARLVDNPRRGAKSGLEVIVVNGGSAAEAAGLLVGDVIVGISAAGVIRYFDNDASAELGKAIAEAEGKRKGRPSELRLCIVRDGKDVQLKAEVMGWGSDGAKFPQGAMGDELAGAALKFLAEKQCDDGSWTSTNRTSRIVQTSLCGLAFLAAGHTPATGTYKNNVKLAAKYVMDNIELPCSATAPNNGSNYDMTNWSLGYGGLFLAELYRAAPQAGLDKTLESIRDRLQANMEASGGFAHGPGGPNELGYTEIATTSNLCLLALGAIQSNGFKADSGKIELAKKYLEACTEPNGGVGYGSQPKGRSRYPGCVGRTAGTILAFSAAGDDKSRFYRGLVKFMGTWRGTVLEGHVSPSMHYLSVAAASYKLGKKDWAEFWDTYRGEFTMLRQADGSITGRWTDDSRKLGYCPDLKYGDVWCTAHWAIILSLPKDNLPVMLGNKGKPKNPAK